MTTFSNFERKSDAGFASGILVFSTFVGLSIHVAWIPLFAVLGATVLSWINVASLAVYLVAFWLVRRAHYRAWGWVLTSEIIVNISITTTFMGWAGGFHYFAFLIAFGAFAVPALRNWERWTAFSLTAVSYCLIYLFNHGKTPLYELPDPVFFQILNIVLLFISVGVLFSAFTSSVRRTVKDLNNTNMQLERIAGTDPLTGLANRRTMYEALDISMNELRSNGKQFCLLIADIDGFKSFNDQYGHACGDFVLVRCAQFMNARFRTEDTVARWGGEEFLILLPDTPLERAKSVAERLRSEIATQNLVFADKKLRVTFTFGVCQSHKGLTDIAQLIKQADEAMMRGKREGKNRTIVVEAQ